MTIKVWEVSASHTTIDLHLNIGFIMGKHKKKNIDFSKVMRKLESSDTFFGFSKSQLWYSSGNYALNHILSGNYKKAFVFGKLAQVAGQSGSGKSLLLATAAKQAMNELEASVLWIDTESASDNMPFFGRLGYTEDELSGKTGTFIFNESKRISDVQDLITSFVNMYRDALKGVDDPMDVSSHGIPPLIIVIDSLNNLMTDAAAEKAEKGTQNKDQGQQAKQNKEFIKAMSHLIKRLPVSILVASHSMVSQNVFAPDEIITGGRGAEYLATQQFIFSKFKLKGDKVEDKDLIPDEFSDEGRRVAGMKCRAVTYKSRFTKPNETVDIQVIYPHGVDPYSGLFDYLMSNHQLKKITAVSYGPENPIEGVPESFKKSNFKQYADLIVEHLNSDEADISRSMVNEETANTEEIVEDQKVVA